MVKELKLCVRWLSSTDDLDYAYDSLYTALKHFDVFYKSNLFNPEFVDSLNSIRADFLLLLEKTESLYSDINSLVVKINSFEDGQTGA